MTAAARALRPLPLMAPLAFVAAPPRAPAISVGLAVIAVLLQLVLSSNLLTAAGIAYDTPGGNLAVKFHPATYLALLALLTRLLAAGRPMGTAKLLIGQFPAVALFLGMMLFLAVYSTISVGSTGVAALVESYAAAGLLWLVLGDASPRQLRLLAWLMLSLFVMNALIAIGETLVKQHVTPAYLGAVLDVDLPEEFRGQALYDHALTGAMMTQMAIFLLLGMRLRLRLTVLFGAPILVGLIAFGGRTALLVSVASLLVLGAFFMAKGTIARTLRPGAIAGALIGAALVAALGFVLLTETSIGVRIAGKLAFDDNSTAARGVQWLIPGLLDFRQLMFGMPLDELPGIVFQLGLEFPFSDIENFWLLAFITYGAIGMFFYLLGFLTFLLHLFRVAPLFGRVALVTIILVASSSNSLGRKSNILFVLTATVLATTGFAQPRRQTGAAVRFVPVGRALRPVSFVQPSEA